MKVHKGSANVYADLGRPDADEMLVRAQLATRIGDLMKQRGLTQTQASRIFGMPQPKISAMLRGQFRGISEDRMMRCLLALGHDVKIVIKPTRNGQNGTLSVSA